MKVLGKIVKSQYKGKDVWYLNGTMSGENFTLNVSMAYDDPKLVNGRVIKVSAKFNSTEARKRVEEQLLLIVMKTARK